MTQIDEKAFREALSHCTGFTVKSLRSFTEVYESARAPRRISRKEFEKLERIVAPWFVEPHKTKDVVRGSLATLGIMVEGE